MKRSTRVSIIILNWNGWKNTVNCLKSLAKITYSNCGIIIVDNGSSNDDLRHLKVKISQMEILTDKVRLICNKENLGFAQGNNVAIKVVLREGRSDYILLLNNDTIVAKDFLSQLIKVGQEEKSVGILGPKIYYADYQGKKDVIQSAGSRVNLSRGKFPCVEQLAKADIRRIDKPTAVDFVTGACLLIKTEVVKKIGLLDQRYFLLFEDTDWCMRAKKTGYQILYVPNSVVWHKTSQAIKKLSSVYYYTRNLFWFEWKNAKPLELLHFLSNYFIFIFPKYFFGYLLIKRNYGLWRDYTKGVIHGIFGNLRFISHSK